MDHRNGICASCEANYTIPASFEHDKARCRECGGTVEIGPIVSDDSNEPMQELEEYVPSGKKRTGPSMMEQLRARQAEAAAEDAPAPPAKAAPKSPVKATAKPVQKPVAKAVPKAGVARKSAAGGGKSKARAGKKSGSGSKRRGASRGGKRVEKEKKKTPMGMLIGVGGIVILLGASLYLFKDDLLGTEKKVDAAENTTASTDASADSAETTLPDAAVESTDTAIDEAAVKPPADAEEDVAAEEPAAEEESTDPKDKYNPAKVDLASLADYGPSDSTSEEEWDEIQTRMIRAMNPDLGKGQTNEWMYLKANPRKSFPAIVNYLIHIDYSTKAGTEQGKWATRIIEDITKGSNYGWAEFEENIDKVGPGYFEWFNKTVAMKWHQNWGNAENDLDTWGRMLKLSAAEVKTLKSKLGGGGDEGLDDDEPSSLDLLNED